MTMYSFGISVGSGVTSPTNVEDLLVHTGAPHILPNQRVPIHGGVRKMTIGGKIRRGGKINHRWQWDYMSQDDFNTLVAAIWGSQTSVTVSITTIDETGTYQTYDCIAERPQPEEHYSLWMGGAVRDLVVNFWDLRLHASFDDSFDLSFG